MTTRRSCPNCKHHINPTLEETLDDDERKVEQMMRTIVAALHGAGINVNPTFEMNPADSAKLAVTFADALLAELAKPKAGT